MDQQFAVVHCHGEVPCSSIQIHSSDKVITLHIGRLDALTGQVGRALIRNLDAGHIPQLFLGVDHPVRGDFVNIGIRQCVLLAAEPIS